MEKKDNSIKIEFTIQNLITITLFFISIYFLWALRAVVVIIFVAFIISSSLAPFVLFLEKKNIKKSYAAIIVYFASMLLIVGLFSLTLIPLINQFSVFVQKLPEISGLFIENVEPIIGEDVTEALDGNFDLLISEFAKQSVNIGDGLFQIVKQAWGVLGLIIGAISLVVLSIYMLIEHDVAVSAILTLIPTSSHERVSKIIKNIEDQMGKWFRGQIVKCFIVGLLTFVIIELIGLPFAFPLALIAGLLEIIPNIGPTLSAIPAIILAIAVGTVPQMIIVPIAYILIQQLENAYISPIIIKKSVGLNPLISMVAFLIGAQLGSTSGMLLAVPVAVVVQILIRELRNS